MMPAAGRMSRRVFVDSSAYYGLADPRDDTHRQAHALAQRIIVDHLPMFTTNFVSAETYSLLLNRMGRSFAGHGCFDPSGMVALASDLACESCSGLVFLAPLRSAPPNVAL